MSDFHHSDIVSSSERVELDTWTYVIKILFNMNLQGNEKLKLSPKGPTTFKILEMKPCLSLITEISAFVGYRIMAQGKHYFVESLLF